MFRRHQISTSPYPQRAGVRLLLAALAVIFSGSVIALRWTNVAAGLDGSPAYGLTFACFNAALAVMAQLLAWDFLHMSNVRIGD